MDGDGSKSTASKAGEDLTVSVPGNDLVQPTDALAIKIALQLILELGGKFNLKRDINDVMGLSAAALSWPAGVVVRLHKFLASRCAENTSWKGVAKLAPQEFMTRFGHWNGTADDATIYYYLDEFAKQNSKDLFAVFRASLDSIEARFAGKRILLIENVAMLTKVLGLTPAEHKILQIASLSKNKRELRPVLVDCKVQSAREAYTLFGTLVGCTADEIAAAIKPGSRMEMLGLVDAPIAEPSITDLSDILRVSDRLLPILLAEYKSEAELMAVFTRPAKPAELTFNDFPHLESDVRYLTALLKSAASRGEKGINVLVYGAPGTGKTQFAKLIAAQAEAELYEVDCLDREGNSLSGKDRYRALQVSQAFLKGRRNTALLFDEVEDVFPTAGRELLSLFGQDDNRTGSVAGKAWVNQTLEENPVPTIWICNAISQIDPAYLRRFQFHLEMKTPPQVVREKITRKYLADLGVDDAFVSKIAARKMLTPAQVQSAARFAALTREETGETPDALVLRQLEQADKAMGFVASDELRVNVTNYDLSLLNVESRYGIEKIITALNVRKRGTLCFYGPPGTGKTALGEHIARSLERPLMIKRASDLMSKYVGETEQQMAQMFRDASNEKAVLLLDEADSFLMNRQQAVRNYEVSEVNEMLQGMERFDGVFICTTNLFDRIDEAALRRFNFKIRFKPLDVEQRERMFIAEALDGNTALMTDALRDGLKKLLLLTPGDFATVKRQVMLLDEHMPAEDFLAMLTQEHAVKPDVRYERKIGF